MIPEILDAGDRAFTLSFGDRIDPDLVTLIRHLDQRIAQLAEKNSLPGLIETVPTFRSLTVIYDPLHTNRKTLLDALGPALAGDERTVAQGNHGMCWDLPVCYGGDYGPDLAEVANQAGSSEADIIQLHTGSEYRVYMLGFLPGFPFLGDVAEPLHLPRRPEPRPRVPPGSVAIASGMTAIYPSASPGGWHLLGRCPVPLFDLADTSPSLLQAGDRVRFHAVNAAAFDELARQLAEGQRARRSFALPVENSA